MSEYTKEEAYDLFDKITDLLEGKPMVMVLEVMANLLRTMCEGLSPQQQAIINMTILDAIGLAGDEDETLQ